MPSSLRPFRALTGACLVLACCALPLAAHAQPAQPPAPVDESPSAAPPAVPAQPQPGPVVEPPPPAPVPAAPAAPADPAAAPAPAAPAPASASAELALEGSAREPERNRHGLGFTGGFTTGSGFSYRRYFGETAAQINGIAIVSDYGEDALVFGGASVIRYLKMWHQGGPRSLMPSVTALRVVGGATFFFSRSRDTETIQDPSCAGQFDCTWIDQEVKDSDTLYGLGAGIGFEFGSVLRPGFSVSLDLLLTAGFDDKGLSFILPLPTAGLMYSW